MGNDPKTFVMTYSYNTKPTTYMFEDLNITNKYKPNEQTKTLKSKQKHWERMQDIM